MNAGKVSNSIISQIAKRIGVAGVKAEHVDAADYDWNACMHYGSSDLEKIKAAMARVSDAIADQLARPLHARPEVSLSSLGQAFASTMPAPGEGDWLLPLSQGRKTCGFLLVGVDSALVWTSRLLGDEAASTSPRQLSDLEKVLLLDVAAIIASAFAATIAPAVPDITAAEGFHAGGDEMLKLEPLTDMTVLTFAINFGSAKSAASIILTSKTLDPLAGIQPPQSLSPEHIRATMLDALRPSMLKFEAILGSGTISISDIFELKPGDVLLLDTTVDQSLAIMAQGQRLCNGTLVQSEGRYAISADGLLTNPMEN